MHAEGLGAVEKSTRELATLQRTFAELQGLRQQDIERLAAAEDAARRARLEVGAATEQLSEQLSALRRSVVEQRDGGTQLGAQLAAVDAMARNAERALQSVASDVAGEVATAAHRLETEIADLKRAVAAQETDRGRDAE